MHFNILTIFPEMFPGTLAGGVVGRALDKKIWTYDVVNIRDFAINNYGSVDDTQFGGGAGMVMRPDALGDALDSIKNPGKIINYNCYFFENLTHFLQPKAIFLLRGCDIWAAYCV